MTPKNLLLRNIRKKLKLREKLRRTYYDDNDECEDDNYSEKKNKPAYSRFFLTNIDLKESLQEKSTIDLNFGLVDNADRSRFFSMNNYVILNSNFKNFNYLFGQSNNKNCIQDDYLEDSFDKKEIKSKFKKYFYDNNAKYVFSTGLNDNYIRRNILRDYYKNKSEKIEEISEMQMEFTRSKFLETSLNSNYNGQNYNSEKKNETLFVEDTSAKKAIINDFLHTGGVYEIKYDESKKQNIVKLSDKKSNKVNTANDFLKKIENVNHTESNNLQGIYSNFEFDNVANLRPSNFLNQIMTTESLCLKDDADFDSNFVITNYEEKNDLMPSINKDVDDKILKNAYDNKSFLISSKLSRKASGEKEDLIDQIPHKNQIQNRVSLPEKEKNNNINNVIKHPNSYKTIEVNELNNKNNSNKKYVKQKSLERNQSTKNLLLDAKHLKRVSKEYEFENNDLNAIMENDNSNKLINKDAENNYCNIQTKKSFKKNNDLIYNPQKPKINLYSNNNKFKKNVNLNRNISGSPSNRLNNLNSNDLSNKDNYRNYYESKLCKEKKERNAKLLTNRNRFTEKEKINKIEGINNLISKNPFKLASEYDSNSKKKSGGLNRVQSVQDLHGEKMKIDKSLFDSKEKKNFLFYSKSLAKNKRAQRIESNANSIRKSVSDKIIEKKCKNNEGKKSPFTNDFCNNVREASSYSKSYKTIKNINNNSSYRESKNPYQLKEKNNDSKANISNNKGNKLVTKFKSNPKIENKRNLSLNNFPENCNSNCHFQKSSSATKITKNNAVSIIKGNQNFEKENLDPSKTSYKNNENSINRNNQSRMVNENDENNNLNISQNKKVNNFISKHKRTYSDFSTPSPIIKTKPKAITTITLKKNNNLNSNGSRVANENYRGKNIDYTNSNNRFYLGDHKNIQSEKASNKRKLNIFETNNNSKQNNLDTNRPNNLINFSNLNSKEANQTIQREEEFRDSNNIENHIINKNIINYDLKFKNIPIFENIEAKQILLNQNSFKDRDSNNNFHEHNNLKKSHTNNQDSNNSGNFVSTSKEKNNNQNHNYNEIRKSNSNTIEESINNFDSTMNKYTAAYSNIMSNKFGMNFQRAKTLNVNNKFEMPSLDNYIYSPSGNLVNKELSINLLSNRKENSENIRDKSQEDNGSNSNNSNKIQENLNDANINNVSNNKSYKIIDTVHLNKFLNSRSNNLNMNSLNIKPKTTTIANFVSISNQDNMKFNLNKKEFYLGDNKTNSNLISNQMNSISTPINQKQEEFLNVNINQNYDHKDLLKINNSYLENQTKNPQADFNLEGNVNKVNGGNKERIDSFNKLTPGINSISSQNINTNLNNLLGSGSNVNNFNKNFNPNNFKNRVFFIGGAYNKMNDNSNSSNNINSNTNSNNTEKVNKKMTYKDENSNQELKTKNSGSSNFNSKTSRLNENSSIENCLQITADNFSKRSNDNASSNQMKNSFNNFAQSSITLNEASENKSSNASKTNLLSINKDSASLPFKIENNFSSINNSKITSNSLNSFSNNSNNKNSNNSNISQNQNINNKNENNNKEGIINANFMTKKSLNSDVNNFNKYNGIGINLNPYYKGKTNANPKSENLFQALEEIENKKTFIDEKEDNNKLDLQKQKQNMHKKTKSSDFNANKEKYSNKFIDTNTNSNNPNNNKNPFYRSEFNGNSNKNFVSNNLTSSLNNRGAVALSASTINVHLNQNKQPNVFISTNISNVSNTAKNNSLNPRHKKNSYSHAFISYAGNSQNNNAINNRNTQNIGNVAFNNYNNQNKIKFTSKMDNKEKEKIILNFSSNNSSNLNFNNISKNHNENSNSLLISPFGPINKNSSSHSNLNQAAKLKGNSNLNYLKK